MSAAVSSRKAGASSFSRLWALLGLALLGGLAIGDGADMVVAGLGGVASLFLGGLLLLLFSWSLRLFFPQLAYRAVKTAVSQGFLLIVPFTILALIAESGLDWTAAGAFAAAGIMTCCAAVGRELAQAGGGKLRSSLLPVLGGMVITAVWMVATTWLGAALS